MTAHNHQFDPTSRVDPPDAPGTGSRGAAAQPAGHAPQAVAAVTLPSSGMAIELVIDPQHQALEDVLAERQRQINSGHTAATDDRKTLASFVQLVWFCAQDTERAWPMGRRKSQDRHRLRRYLVKLGALILATIERIDREFPNG